MDIVFCARFVNSCDRVIVRDPNDRPTERPKRHVGGFCFGSISYTVLCCALISIDIYSVLGSVFVSVSVSDGCFDPCLGGAGVLVGDGVWLGTPQEENTARVNYKVGAACCRYRCDYGFLKRSGLGAVLSAYNTARGLTQLMMMLRVCGIPVL